MIKSKKPLKRVLDKSDALLDLNKDVFNLMNKVEVLKKIKLIDSVHFASLNTTLNYMASRIEQAAYAHLTNEEIAYFLRVTYFMMEELHTKKTRKKSETKIRKTKKESNT